MKSGGASSKRKKSGLVRIKVTRESQRKAMASVDWDRIDAMTDEEIERNALDDPDSIVPFPDDPSDVVYVPAMPDVAAMRKRMKLTQRQFALRFGFSLATVRNWEQGRALADGPARVLLTVIDTEPRAVMRALNPSIKGTYGTSTKRRAA
jgi:putative transcriptional regulator